MKALCWRGKHGFRCDDVADPTIQHGRDVYCYFDNDKNDKKVQALSGAI